MAAPSPRPPPVRSATCPVRAVKPPVVSRPADGRVRKLREVQELAEGAPSRRGDGGLSPNGSGRRSEGDPPMNPLRKAAIGGAIAVAAVTGGAIGASLLGTANAADTTTSTSTPAASSTPAAPPQGQAPQGPHQANGKTETLLTGSDADKATAAALKAVPGGTIQRVETDADGDAYEAHMLKSDGTPVTVKLDSSFNLVRVEDGPSGGGHGHGGPPPSA